MYKKTGVDETPENKLHDAWINELNQAIEDACFALKPR